MDIRQDTKEKNVLFVASDTERKNIYTLIKALSLLKDDYKINLLKVGSNNDRKGLIGLLKEYGINFKLFENISDESLVEVYNKSDVYVCTSLDEGGFALPILEAMACGCPVIISNIEPFREVLSEYQIPMIQPFDYHGFADEIRKVFEDDSHRKNLVNEGFKVVRNHTWDKSAKEMEKVYRGIIDES